MSLELKEKLENEVLEHKGELVLCMFDIMLLLEGIVDDGEDYYYRLCSPFNGFQEFSCVWSWIALKNNIGNKTYQNLINIFKLNYKYHTTPEQQKEIKSLIG